MTGLGPGHGERSEEKKRDTPNERLNLRARHFADVERKTMIGDEEDTEEEKEEGTGILHK